MSFSNFAPGIAFRLLKQVADSTKGLRQPMKEYNSTPQVSIFPAKIGFHEESQPSCYYFLLTTSVVTNLHNHTAILTTQQIPVVSKTTW